MKLQISRRKVAVFVVALLLVVGGVGAYTGLFTAGAGTTYETDSGLAVTASADHDVASANPFNGSDTVYINNVSFSASGGSSVTVDQFEGTTTQLSSIDATGSAITIDPGDKSALTVSGDVTKISFEDARLDATSQITYSADGSGTITVTGLPANTNFAARTTSGTVLTSGTTDSSGTADIPVNAATDEQIVLLEPDSPTIDNSSASPAEGAETTEKEVTLSINVSDQDFGSPSDELQVTFYVDGQQVGTDTLTANGTASTTTEVSIGGEVNWSVDVSDEYGLSTSSETFTFKSPAELTFRNENNPSEILTNVTVNVTAYYGDETVRRNVSNGTLDLTNFPVDEPIIIRASGENYTTRTAVIESIYEQSNVYLLKKDVATYNVRFDLQDATGEYPRDDTVLFVERDIELNGSVEWRVISGDNFGVQGVPVTLEQDERYRLRVRNLETGATATIGAFTPVQNETVTISPGSATIDIVDSESDYGWSVSENETGQYILFEYFDDVNETDSVKLTIHERFNNSNVLVDNETFTDANNIVYQVPMTANQTNKTWMAEIYVDRGGNVTHYREPITSGASNILPANLGEHWASGVGVFIMLITGMAFSELNRSAGAVATALAGGMLWQLGFLSTVSTGPAIILAIGISVLYHYRTGGGQ